MVGGDGTTKGVSNDTAFVPLEVVHDSEDDGEDVGHGVDHTTGIMVGETMSRQVYTHKPRQYYYL